MGSVQHRKSSGKRKLNHFAGAGGAEIKRRHHQKLVRRLDTGSLRHRWGAGRRTRYKRFKELVPYNPTILLVGISPGEKYVHALNCQSSLLPPQTGNTSNNRRMEKLCHVQSMEYFSAISKNYRHMPRYT